MSEQPDLLLQNNTTAPWQQRVTKTYQADASEVTIPGLHDWNIAEGYAAVTSKYCDAWCSVL